MTLLIPAAVGSASSLGARTSNQDRLAIALPWGYVLDGVGGSQRGAEAAQIALADLLSSSASSDGRASSEDMMRHYIEHAHLQVVARLGGSDGRSRGASTVTAVHLRPRQDGKVEVTLGSVGDSPAWIVTKGSVPVRLTRSAHQLGSPHLSDALGWPSHHLDLASVTVSSHSRIILATDGIEPLESKLRDMVAADFRLAPQACAENLVNCALKAGSHDNSTAVVIDLFCPLGLGVTDHLDIPVP